jgi:hypothetical protein
METVIGLGQAGCNVAEKFMQYPQYKVYLIDTEQREGSNFKKFQERKTHEEYENKCPSLKSFFENVNGSCLFVVAGGGAISGATLRVLEQLKHCDINVLYVKPDITLISEKKQLRERVVRNILQEFARSGLLKKLYIVENEKLEAAIGDIPIASYYHKLNEALVYAIHMINVFDNTTPVLGTFSESSEITRISTLGMVDVQNGAEKLFYDLKYPREKYFYYAINSKDLESRGELLKQIVSQVRAKNDDISRSFYSIYATEYEQNFSFCVFNTNFVQEADFENFSVN